jgi:DNA-binding XRE family transcriptional regulator
MTQAQLAARLGVQRSTIIDLEAGARGPRLNIVISALNALDVRLWADIGDGAPPPNQKLSKSKKDDADINTLVDDMLDDL